MDLHWRFDLAFLTMKQRNELVEGFDAFVQKHMDAGWHAYLVTFMFRQLAGGNSAKINQMKRAVEKWYSTFLTRVVRFTKAKCDKPILIGMPDLPVAKSGKKSATMDVLVNDGLHVHGILLIPRKSRLTTPLKDHLDAHADTYLGRRDIIERLEVDPIVTKASCKVTDYVFKGLQRGLSYDDLIVLPKSFSELAKTDRRA